MLQVLNILDESKALSLKCLLALSNVLRTDQRANPLPGSLSGLRDVQAPTAAGPARRPQQLENLRAALTLQAEPERNQTPCPISWFDTV